MGDSSFPRVLLVCFFICIGLLAAILFAFVMEGSGNLYVLGAGAILILLLSIFSVIIYGKKQRTGPGTAGTTEAGSQVGFVVDTFHDLVAKLKDKERELEKLRAFAEEKAGRMEAYNENILQSVPSGVISVDNSLMIKSFNQAAEGILGMDAQSVIGRKFDEVFREPLSGILSADKTVLRAEYPYAANDNRHMWLGITTSQLKNAEDEKIGLIFVFTDLTDIKALQSQVELKERLSQLGEMSAGISHELRNSMSVISGYARLLSKRVAEANKSTVDAIQSEIGIMDRIISELLAFAKPSVLNREETALHDLCNEIIEAVAARTDSITISLSEAEPMVIQADTVLLRQALTNLVTNAVEAMPDGGAIDIETGLKDGKAEIRITDRGRGIPEDIQHKIFLPFFTTKEEGIGFGLALVQKIIVSHGGSIAVHSREGEGTSFMITLPAGE